MADSKYKLRYEITADASKAKAELQNVDRLLNKVGGAKGFQSSVKGITSEVSNLAAIFTGNKLSGATSQISSLGNAFSAIPGPAGLAVGAVAGIGAAAVTASVALFALSKQAATFGSEIFDASEKTGLHAESLSAMKFAADQSSSSLEQVTGGLARFAKTVGEAAGGSEEAAKKLKALGITPQEAINDLDGALSKVMKRIVDAKPGIEQITLAQKAFGKSGADLLPFMKSFGGDLDALRKKAKELGITIDDDAARAADEFGDQLDTLSAQFAGVGRTIGQAFMPIFMHMAQETSEWAVRNKDEIKDWSNNFAAGVEASADALTRFIREAREWQSVRDLIALDLAPARFMDWATGIGEARERIRQRRIELSDREDAVSEESRRLIEEKGGRLWRPKQPVYDPSLFGEEKGSGGRKITGSRQEKVSEMERFFEGIGDHVSNGLRKAGSKIAGTNKLSKHGEGEAVDVRTKDRTTDQVVTTISKAIEHGFRIYDERLHVDAKGQKQPHLHAEANTNKASTFYNDPKLYGGQENLDALKQLDAERLGKAAGPLKKIKDDQVKAADDANRETLAIVRQGLDDEVQLYGARTDTVIAKLEEGAAAGRITEQESIDLRMKAEEDFLQFKLQKLQEEGIAFAGNQHEEARIAQETALLTETIEQTKAKNAAARATAEKKRHEDRYKSWAAYIDQLERVQELEDENFDRNVEEQNRIAADKKEKALQDKLNRTVGSGQTVGAMDQLRDHFVGDQNTAAIAGIDALSSAFQGLGDAVGQTLSAYVLYGSAGQSVQQVTAQILAGIAQQAAVKAIFELAEGFAALAMSFFGVPNAGPSATAHFAAAAIYGGIAGIAALAGRAAAGDSMKGGGQGGGSSVGSSSSKRDAPATSSRASDDAFISGTRQQDDRLAAAIEEFNRKVSTAKPGEVFINGMKQNRGAVSKQMVSEMGSNAGVGRDLRRRSGLR